MDLYNEIEINSNNIRHVVPRNIIISSHLKLVFEADLCLIHCVLNCDAANEFAIHPH